MDSTIDSAMVAPIPLERDKHWRKKLTCILRDLEKCESRILEFANIKDLPPIFMELLSEQEASKIRFRNGKVYVRNNETPLHRTAIMCLAINIMDSSFGMSRDLNYAMMNYLIVVNKFSCGTLTKNIPDALFEYDDETDPKVSFEVSFAQEDLNELYLESVHSLTEYTTIEYFFGLKIYQSNLNNDFRALFFVMKRAQGNRLPDPDGRPAEVERIYYPTDDEEDGGIQGAYHCVCVLNDKGNERHEFPFDDLEAQRIGYGVEVFFSREINERNYYRNVVVPIDSARDRFTLKAREIRSIRESYRHWWRRKFETRPEKQS